MGGPARKASSPWLRYDDALEPELHKCIVMSVRVGEAFLTGVRSCASCYIVLAVTASFLSNYVVFSSDIQHLFGEMNSMAANDSVGLTTYSLFIHCLLSLIAAAADSQAHAQVIRHGDDIFVRRTLHTRARVQI